MRAEEIISAIHRGGGNIWLEGDKVRAHLPESLASLVDLIRSQKAELIAALAHRPEMPEGVRLVRWEPKHAPVSLSLCETVTDVDPFIRSTLREVASRISGDDWRAGNWTLSALIDRLADVGCIVELEEAKAALQ